MNQDLQNLEIKVENDGATPQGRLTATEWNILVAAVKSLDLAGGSADVASILQVVANAGYATQEWVTSQKYITSSALDNLAKNLVTLDTTQAITGIKDFTNGLKIGGLPVYKLKDSTIFIDANLVVTGAFTMHGSGSTTFPTIWANIPFDSTMRWNGSEWSVVGGGGSSTGGGISIADVENYLTTNGYATQSWVAGKGYIMGITGAMVTNALEYTPLSTSGGTITATGRRQLSLQSSTGAQAALWLGTGLEQFSKGGFLQYDYSNGSIALVNFSAMANSYSGLAGLFIKRDNRITVGDANLSVEYDVLHSGNYGDYALPITGGTVNGAIIINDYAKITNNLYLGGVLRNANATWLLGENASDGTLTIGSGSYAQERCLHNYNGKLRLTAEGGVEAQLTYLDSDPTLGALDTKGVVRQVAGNYGWGIYSWVRNTGNGYIQVGTDSRYAAPKASNLILQVLGGNVAIGGTTASEKLHVYGNMLFEGERVLKSSLIGEVLYMGGSYLVIGGGTTTKGIPTYIDGKTVYVRAGNYVATFSDAGGLTWNGNLLANGAITMFYSSDERLKKNIRKVNASEVLMSLGGIYQYEYIDSEVAKNSTYGGSHYGLIYQNVKGTALDKMCHKREDGFGALNYLDTNFISLIAGATMENISEIEKLKKANRELKKKVEQLEKRVA